MPTDFTYWKRRANISGSQSRTNPVGCQKVSALGATQAQMLVIRAHGRQ